MVSLTDKFLRDTLEWHPELRTVFGKIDPEEQPASYAAFVAKVLEQALREEIDPERRLVLCNHSLVMNCWKRCAPPMGWTSWCRSWKGKRLWNMSLIRDKNMQPEMAS